MKLLKMLQEWEKLERKTPKMWRELFPKSPLEPTSGEIEFGKESWGVKNFNCFTCLYCIKALPLGYFCKSHIVNKVIRPRSGYNSLPTKRIPVPQLMCEHFRPHPHPMLNSKQLLKGQRNWYYDYHKLPYKEQ